MWPVGLALLGVLGAALLLFTPPQSDAVDSALPQLDAPEDPAEGVIEWTQAAGEAAVPEAPGWYPVVSSAIELGLNVDTELVGAIMVDGRRFIVTTAAVLELVQSGAQLGLTRSEGAPEIVGTSLAISAFGFGGSPVQIYTGLGGWTGGSRSLADVRAAGRSALTGSLPDGLLEWYVVVADETARWSVLPGPPGTTYVTHPVADGWVGQELSNGRAVGDAVFSSDGLDWTPIPRWTLAATIGAHPLLVASDESPLVGSTNRLPEVEPIRLPERVDPTRVLATDDGIVALEDGSIHVRTRVGGWTTIPVDAEHGVAAPAVPVSVDPPRIATIVGDRLTVLAWSN